MTEQLLDGGVNIVVRSGDTVRRPTGAHTPAVHALLDHLTRTAPGLAPRVHGIDEHGREILDFLPGRVAHPPLPAFVTADANLRAAGALIRRLHDATTGFTTEHPWTFAPRGPAEVICHGDLAPYNCLYDGGEPVAFIDFDTAHPGPRVWDLAHAAYRFCGLTDPKGPEHGAVPGVQAHRLRVFTDGYRLSDHDRAALVTTAVERLDAHVTHMHAEAAAGNSAFARHIDEGHDRLYRRDMHHLRTHAMRFTAALMA